LEEAIFFYDDEDQRLPSAKTAPSRGLFPGVMFVK
jgi:hypothetical protein